MRERQELLEQVIEAVTQMVHQAEKMPFHTFRISNIPDSNSDVMRASRVQETEEEQGRI